VILSTVVLIIVFIVVILDEIVPLDVKIVRFKLPVDDDDDDNVDGIL
jgi:hypothetical protein